MGWRFKSAQFKVLSNLPGGTFLYKFLQDHVTRSTVATRLRIGHKLDVGLDFWKWLQKERHTGQLCAGRLLDYGSGWHPTMPLLWYAFGCDRQTLADITPNMDARKVTDGIKVFRAIASEPDWPGRQWLKRLPETRLITGPQAGPALAQLGIEYCAPYGSVLRNRPGHYDAIICTQVLQYIPKPTLAALFNEFYACLKSSGLLYATIHFVGHFRDPGLRQGHYEHLVYSPPVWERWFNSSLMSFNRLKGPDYREVLEQSGFKLREFKLTLPTDADLAELRRTRVHSCFNHYSEQDLATLGVFVVAERP
jgi:Methyltransferase domain